MVNLTDAAQLIIKFRQIPNSSPVHFTDFPKPFAICAHNPRCEGILFQFCENTLQYSFFDEYFSIPINKEKYYFIKIREEVERKLVEIEDIFKLSEYKFAHITYEMEKVGLDKSSYKDGFKNNYGFWEGTEIFRLINTFNENLKMCVDIHISEEYEKFSICGIIRSVRNEYANYTIYFQETIDTDHPFPDYSGMTYCADSRRSSLQNTPFTLSNNMGFWGDCFIPSYCDRLTKEYAIVLSIK